MSSKKPTPRPIEYSAYLKLEELLSIQVPESGREGCTPAHDELLFIITHQAYELWFKQILHELDSAIGTFSGSKVEDRQLGTVIHRLERVNKIQELLLEQIDVIETMTPLDFLDFRDLLVPASGFQSIQFKLIEIRLGLRFDDRTGQDRDFFMTRLTESQRQQLSAAEAAPTLLDVTNRWLERMPFSKYGEFDFWRSYGQAVDQMLESELKIVASNQAISEDRRKQQVETQQQTREKFNAILDKSQFDELHKRGSLRLSHQAFLAVLFIHLYRDEPMLYAPFRYLVGLMEIDEAMTRWRSRHAMMVHRMLGAKIGTGGSSGHDYLAANVSNNRVWTDLFNISTFLIPRSQLPALPPQLARDLGFHFSGRQS